MTTKKNKPVASPETITAYKGFDSNWKCRDIQYEVGKTFKHKGRVTACESGFHACEHPLDIFRYYAPALNKFAVVTQSGKLSRHDYDSKIASSSITIEAEIDIPGIITAAFEYIRRQCAPANTEHATGDSSASSATGDRSASSATGYRSASLTTGSYSASEVTKPDSNSVAIGVGYANKAKASIGCAIVLAYRDVSGCLIRIRASKVCENGIKPDVWYSLDTYGEFVEVPE